MEERKPLRLRHPSFSFPDHRILGTSITSHITPVGTNGRARLSRYRTYTTTRTGALIFLPASSPRNPGWLEVRTLWLSMIAAVGAFFSERKAGAIPHRFVDPLPVAEFRPQSRIMVAGFPVWQVVGHHSPGSSGEYDAENPIMDASAGMHFRSRTPGVGFRRQNGLQSLIVFLICRGGVVECDEWRSVATSARKFEFRLSQSCQ
jgi:hypothetical protein